MLSLWSEWHDIFHTSRKQCNTQNPALRDRETSRKESPHVPQKESSAERLRGIEVHFHVCLPCKHPCIETRVSAQLEADSLQPLTTRGYEFAFSTRPQTTQHKKRNVVPHRTAKAFSPFQFLPLRLHGHFSEREEKHSTDGHWLC